MSTQPAIVIRRTTDTVLELMSGPLVLSNGQWGLAKGEGKLVCRDDEGEFHTFVDVAGLSDAIVNLSYARSPVANRMALPTTDPVGATRMTLDTRKIYKRLQGGGWQDIVEDAGRVNLYGGVTSVPPPSFTHLGNGLVSIPSCTVALYDNEYYVGFPREYVIPGKTLQLTDGLSQYVVASYNSGTPEYQITLNDRDFDFSWRVPVMRLWYAGGEVHSASCDSLGVGLPEKLADRVTATDYYARRDGEGLILSVDAGRHPIVTAAYVFAGAAEVDVQAYNGNTDKLTEAVWNGTTYVFNTVSGGAISNAQYQGASGTVVLGTGKYAAHWIYRSIGDVKECFILYGRDQYSNLAEAQQASPYMGPLPTVITDHCMLVGRVVVQQGSQTTYVTIPFTSQFAGVAVTAHNNLAGLNTGDYQHLTAAQLTALTTGVSTTQHKHDASGIVNTPAGNIAATTVQAAINELDTEKQPVDPTLSAMAGVATSADKIIYFTGTDAATSTTLSAYGRSLIDDADAATARGTLSVYSKAEADITASDKVSKTDTTQQDIVSNLAAKGNRGFISYNSDNTKSVMMVVGPSLGTGADIARFRLGGSATAAGWEWSVSDTSQAMSLGTGGTLTAAGKVIAKGGVESKDSDDTQPKIFLRHDAPKIEFGPGDATAVDTNLYRSAANYLTTDGGLRVYGELETNKPSAGSQALKVQIFGESYYRFLAQGDGKLWWGPGTAAADVNLYRNGVNALKTDDELTVGGNLIVVGSISTNTNFTENGVNLATKYQGHLSKGALDTCTADWNTYTGSGYYKVEPSTGSWVTAWTGTGSNGPVEAYPWGVLVVSYGNSAGILQTYTAHRSPGLLEGGIWYRTCVNGTWTSDWKHVLDVDYLDTIYAPTTHPHAVSDIVDIANNYVNKSTSTQQTMNASLRSFGTLSSERTNTTHTGFAAMLTGDTVPRLVVLADGKMQWGTGNAAADVNLYRNGANALRTDDELTVGGNLVIVGSIIQGGNNLDDKYQPKDGTLSAMAGVTTAADKIIYFTGTDAATSTALSSFGRSLIDDADAAAGRTTLSVYSKAETDAKYADSTEAVMKNNTSLQTMTGGLRASLSTTATTTSISAFDAKQVSSGTAAAGFGVSYDFYLADATNPTGFQAGAVEAVAEGSLSTLMNSRLEFAVAVTGVPTRRATLSSAGTFDAVALSENGTGLSTKYQGKDSTLTAMAGQTTAADKIIYFTGTDAASTTTLSSFGRSLIDDTDAATARGTLGAAPTSHASTATTYGVGTSANYGHVKLYTGTGTATDGTMDQNSLKTALDAKASLGGASFTGAISSSQCITTAECGGGYLIQTDAWETVTYSTATATHTPTGGNTRIELTYAGAVQLTINAAGAGSFNGTHVYLTVKGTYGYSASVTIFIKSVYGGTVTVSTTSTKLMHLHLVSNGVSGWFLTSAET